MSYEEQRMKYLREKYGMSELELDGRPEQKERTLQDVVDQSERDAVKNLKLAFGTTNFQGKPLRLWYERSR